MKKIFSILMCICMLTVSVFAFAGCSKNMSELTYDVVMITDGGTIKDGSYNESAWNGVKEYAEGAGMSYRYYQPALTDGELTVETATQYINLAVKVGAQYIVLPTDVYESAVFENAQKYPDVKFILVDGMPHAEGESINAYLDNVMCITFNTLQSGFLAGYNAVISGNTELGYFGSFYNNESINYGAGFVQGAQYAADQLAIPVTLDYADYDSPLLNYDYSFTITANYAKIDDIADECFVVNVENGTGSGTYTNGSNVLITADPAPEGMVFDHWDYKSDTEGVKDKKVNLSTTKKTETNLVVEKCSCTITAVYKEAESETYPVTVMNADGTVYSTQFIVAGASCMIKAPAAEHGFVLDNWNVSTSDDSVVYYNYDSHAWFVNMPEDNAQAITLTPVYTQSTVPTFDVTVVTGEGGNGESTGSGSYVKDEVVELAAAVPQEGYIFTHWSNEDSYGYGAGISMENEFYPYTSFVMANRFQSIPETMYDEGVSLIFAGGNDECNAVSDATWNYNYQKWAVGAENWQSGWNNYYSTTIKDYGSAVKACLENFEGGHVYTADCSNNGIWMTFVAEENLDAYNTVYEALGNGDITLINVPPKADVRQIVTSNCLTLDYWVVV